MNFQFKQLKNGLRRILCLPKRFPSTYAMPSTFFNVSSEVKFAKEKNLPIVALESTIIAHGMPFPENLKMAVEVEEIIRKSGAVPATIGIAKGKLCVGMSSDALKDMAKAGSKVQKCSTRDLAVTCAQNLLGATTVASTMLIANKAGIDVFVTGGIGGVHRGGEISMDISADLRELGRTPVAVVCAGIKSILDIGKTLEYLETEGVPVVGYGTDDFPAFFSPTSGFKAPMRLDTPSDVAKSIFISKFLKIQQGMVIAVPNPSPVHGENIEQAIKDALKMAERKSIGGKDITPFILSEVNKKSKGASLSSNLSLVKNNARVGAEIAVALNRYQLQHRKFHCARISKNSPAPSAIVVGGAVQDLVGRPLPGKILGMNTSNPGTLCSSVGGVGRNIAEVLTKLGISTTLISAVGKDMVGDVIVKDCQNKGIKTHAILCKEDMATATYLCILDEAGNLHTAIADMEILLSIDEKDIKAREKDISLADVVVADGNLSASCLRMLGLICKQNRIPVVFEPVSEAKATFAANANLLKYMNIITPNIGELKAMCKILPESHHQKYHDKIERVMMSIQQVQNELCVESDEVERYMGLIKKVLPHIFPVLDAMHSDVQESDQKGDGVSKSILVTLGENGALLFSAKDQNFLKTIYFPALPAKVSNVNGAGDALAAAVAFGVSHEQSLENCVNLGLSIAKQTVESHFTIPLELFPPSSVEIEGTISHTFSVSL